MSLSESFHDTEELDPIDIVEFLAEQQEWDFDRITDGLEQRGFTYQDITEDETLAEFVI